MNFPTDIFTTRAPEDVVTALAGCGFKQVRTERPRCVDAMERRRRDAAVEARPATE